MVERIRDATVAEEIAAQAGTDQTPELVLGEILTPIIFAPQRPPLAQSGYFPGTIGINAVASVLNFSHCGIFGSGVGRAIVRVNYVIVHNGSGGRVSYHLRRLDSPFAGFPSVRAVPGYINAGNPSTGGVFSLTKNDSIATSGVLLGVISVEDTETIRIPGPWILNDGALLISSAVINQEVEAVFGYEHWGAIRVQPPG